jgi:hypothetical protein
LLAAAGCLHAPRGPAIPACPGALRPTGEIPGDLRLRLHMRLQARDLDTSLELAVEKRGDELVVVGLDPFGVKNFSIVQRGVAVKVDALPPAVLPTAPENVLRDLHRVRFLALAPPPGGEGEVQGSFDGARVTEQWQGGRLAWRRFAGAAGDVRVEFADDHVRIDNPACGYRASLSEISAEKSP